MLTEIFQKKELLCQKAFSLGNELIKWRKSWLWEEMLPSNSREIRRGNAIRVFNDFIQAYQNFHKKLNPNLELPSDFSFKFSEYRTQLDFYTEFYNLKFDLEREDFDILDKLNNWNVQKIVGYVSLKLVNQIFAMESTILYVSPELLLQMKTFASDLRDYQYLVANYQITQEDIEELLELSLREKALFLITDTQSKLKPNEIIDICEKIKSETKIDKTETEISLSELDTLVQEINTSFCYEGEIWEMDLTPEGFYERFSTLTKNSVVKIAIIEQFLAIYTKEFKLHADRNGFRFFGGKDYTKNPAMILNEIGDMRHLQ